MSTIEAILVSSEPVKGRTSKTKWRQSSLAFIHDSPFRKSDHTYFTEIFVTLYYRDEDKTFNESVCLLARSQLFTSADYQHS